MKRKADELSGAAGPSGVAPCSQGPVPVPGSAHHRGQTPPLRGSTPQGGDSHSSLHLTERFSDVDESDSAEEDSHAPAVTAAASRSQPATLRLQQAALCGLLWHTGCQQATTAASGGGAGEQSPAPIPTTFQSVQQYVDTFEPLLYEEARCAVLKEWEEVGGGGRSSSTRGWRVTASQHSEEAGGWFTVVLTPTVGRAGQPSGPRPHRLRPDSVVVLNRPSTQQTPFGSAAGRAGGTAGGSSGGGSGGGAGAGGLLLVAGVVRQGNMRDAMDPLTVALHPACPAHANMGWDAPCMQAVKELFAHHTGWHVAAIGNLVTHERECETLARVAQGRQGPMRTLLPMLLDPAAAAQRCQGRLAQVWPQDFANPEVMHRFGAWLAESYDLEQRDAIVIATSHMALEDQLRTSPVPILPFTLIQGPPGTGKTHTVKGILNMWHVIKYRRHHDAWRVEAARMLRTVQETYRKFDRDKRILELLSDLPLPVSLQRPRVLVCAPSNAATDELCERILKEGFRDLDLNVTFPDIARVGSEDAAMAESVKEVWIEARVRTYLNMTHQQFSEEFFKAEARQQQAMATMQSLIKRLDSYALRGEQGYLELAGALVNPQAQRMRAALELERLGMVAGRFVPGQRVRERQLRESLELSCMEAAELVFTTLSSTGRHIFSKFKKPFDAVLIDEACQAAEVAALQPLVQGTQKVVLVGDPKQLPATLFSRSARETAMERSLFERFAQAGVPVKLLAVQYRMHPEIRSFPSVFFYDDQLKDAPQVLALPPAPFYSSNLLKPYVVFDVRHGREGSGAGSRSKCNEEEAKMAAALYWELKCEMQAALEAWQADPRSQPEPMRQEIGIVTPYKSQRDLIRKTFLQLFGEQCLQDVRIETVDSFQGKQLDVIILSCVRAVAAPSSGTSSHAHSIGFLADTRRLNVAITRAKRALWILGQAQSLSQHNVWRALIEDAESRGLVIQEADANDPGLVPRFTQHLDALARGSRHTTPEPSGYDNTALPIHPPPPGIVSGYTSQQQQQQPHMPVAKRPALGPSRLMAASGHDLAQLAATSGQHPPGYPDASAQLPQAAARELEDGEYVTAEVINTAGYDSMRHGHALPGGGFGAGGGALVGYQRVGVGGGTQAFVQEGIGDPRRAGMLHSQAPYVRQGTPEAAALPLADPDGPRDPRSRTPTPPPTSQAHSLAQPPVASQLPCGQTTSLPSYSAPAAGPFGAGGRHAPGRGLGRGLQSAAGLRLSPRPPPPRPQAPARVPQYAQYALPQTGPGHSVGIPVKLAGQANPPVPPPQETGSKQPAASHGDVNATNVNDTPSPGTSRRSRDPRQRPT